MGSTLGSGETVLIGEVFKGVSIVNDVSILPACGSAELRTNPREASRFSPLASVGRVSARHWMALGQCVRHLRRCEVIPACCLIWLSGTSPTPEDSEKTDCLASYSCRFHLGTSNPPVPARSPLLQFRCGPCADGFFRGGAAGENRWAGRCAGGAARGAPGTGR